MEVLETYHIEVTTLMLDGAIQQLMKLQLTSLNLFVESKVDLQSLDTGGDDNFLKYFEPFDLTITVSPFLEFTKKKSVVVDHLLQSWFSW